MFIVTKLTAGLIKMPLGAAVGLGPGDIVLDSDPAPQNGAHTYLPIFGPCLLLPNDWWDQDAKWSPISATA